MYIPYSQPLNINYGTHIKLVTHSNSWEAKQRGCVPFQREVPSFNFALLKRLVKLNYPEWNYGAVGSFTSILIGLIAPMYAIYIAEFIRILSLSDADDQYTARRSAASQLLVFGAFWAPLNYLQNFCFAQCNSKLTLRMRELLCKSLFKKEIIYFDNPKNNEHRLVNIFIRDAVDINGATALKCAICMQAFSTIVSSTVISFLYCWQLAIPMLAILFPALIASTYYTGRLYSLIVLEDSRYQRRIRKMTQEAFANIKTLVILVKEEFFIRKCQNIFQLMHRKKMKEAIKFGLVFGLSEGFVYFAFAVAFYLGSYLVETGMAEYTSVYKVLGTTVIGSIMIGRILWDSPDFRKGKVALGKLSPLIETATPLTDVPAETKGAVEQDKISQEGEQCKGSLSFENVTFKDPNHPDIYILDRFSLSIKSGETVAIIGAKDLEKKAIIELLQRFYSPRTGMIKLDNMNIQMKEKDWLASQITAVKLEALFPDISITENLLYGTTSEMTEMIATCNVFGIHESIVSLPKGYDTKLEDAELPFHAQRLVIVRAFLRDTPITFLDCGSLALNLPSEKYVRELMLRALVGKTTIILADRVSLVENVRKIVVVDQGQVAEIGEHDTLMAAEGIYYRLVNCQRNLKERL